MIQSATRCAGAAARRAQRRRDTEHRITRTAQRLTDERGLDGFTLDELATSVGVSRRTLFNYFPSKIDAVLGPIPDPDEQAVADFVAGGPTGDLVEDLIALARTVIVDAALDREQVALARRVLLAEPRLIAHVHARFDDLAHDFADLLVRRTGSTVDHDSARLLLRVVVATYDVALADALAGPDGALGGFADVFADHVRELRRLFCC